MERSTIYISPEEQLYGFDHGINCAMYVFGTMAPKVGFDTQQARRIAALIGGGMGRSVTCGCVTGAYMALGYRFANDQVGEVEKLAFAKQLRSEFNQRFVAEFGSLECRDMLDGLRNCDPEDLRIIQEKDLYRTVCTRAINTACSIVEDIISKHSQEPAEL